MGRKKTDAVNVGMMKSIMNGNPRSDFDFDFNTSIKKIENEIKQVTRPGKIKRCFNCQACGKPRTLRQMSAFINLCRPCLAEAKTKGQIAQSNFISRITNNFLKSIRAEVMQ